MIVKIFALMANLVMAKFNATISPNELTIIQFDGKEIKVDREDEEYTIKPEIGGGEKGKVTLTTHVFDRGIFMKMCDI